MKVEKVLLTEEQIQKKIIALGQTITNEYQDKEVIFVGILKGCFVFFADLLRHIDLDCKVDFMSVSSYGNTTVSSGVVRIEEDLKCDIAGKHVIIVEDIVDTGLTLSYLKENLQSRNPASLKICSLLDKKECRKLDIHIDFIGFEIPDKFVVGYGLDFAENYRNLPYIAILNNNN